MKRQAKKVAGKADAVDRAVTHTAAAAHRSRPVRIAAAIGEVADQPPLIALSALTLAAGLLLRHRRIAETGARMLASHLLATAIKTVIKHRVDRTRPHSVKDGKRYRAGKGRSRSHHHSSFPSGHTAGIVAVNRAVGRMWPQGATAAAASSVAIGALQLPAANHYGGDVLAGAAIGLASEAAVDRAARWIIGHPPQ